MSTIYARSAGAISGVSWYDAASGGSPVSAPVAGDAVVLNGQALTLDVAAWPAVGAFLSITDAAKTGSITAPLDTLGNCAISATTITCGTVTTGFIRATGTAPAATLTVTGNCTGGTATNAACVVNDSSGHVIVTGTLAGGAASSRAACRNGGTGTMTVNGNGTGVAVLIAGINTTNINGSMTGSATVTNAHGIVTAPGATSATVVNIDGNLIGGGGLNAHGMLNDQGVTVNLTGNMIDGTGAVAYAGKPLNWINAGANYIQRTITEGVVKFVRQPVIVAGQLTMHADVTRFRDYLIASPAFASWCGAEDPAACAVLWQHTLTAQSPNALCVIMLGDGRNAVRQACGLNFRFAVDSKISLYFDRKTTHGDVDSTVIDALVQAVDAIMMELCASDGLISGFAVEPGFPVRNKPEKIARDSAKLLINVDSMGY